MSKLFLNYLNNTKKIKITLSKRIGGGGAGDVYKLSNDNNNVVKLYKYDKDKKLYEPKVKAMVLRGSKLLGKHSNQIIPYAWPIAVIENSRGDFLGFLMPEIDFEGTVSLERMLQKKIRTVSGLPEFFGHRISLAYNLAISLSKLHQNNIFVIDLKPTNCRVDKKNMYVSIIDCDGFSINDGSLNYPGYQYTSEYIAPESVKKKPEDVGEEHDLFALSVIIFKLLNNGLHPYQAKLKSKKALGTLQDSISQEYYSYGLKPSQKCYPANQSIHMSFPNEIRNLFDKSFLSYQRPKAFQWSEILKSYASPASNLITRCKVKPEEHGYFGELCPLCEIEKNHFQKLNSSSKFINTNFRKSNFTLKKGVMLKNQTIFSNSKKIFLYSLIFFVFILFKFSIYDHLNFNDQKIKIIKKINITESIPKNKKIKFNQKIRNEKVFKLFQNKKYSKIFDLIKNTNEITDDRIQYILGFVYQNGYGTNKNIKKAIKWFNLASRNGNVKATTNLGWFYENGIGVEKNYDKAYDLYKISAGKGDKTAKRNLKILLHKKN